MFDFIKYDVIGVLTPNQKNYNAQLQGRIDAHQNKMQTRNSAVLRVWYLNQLKEWDFFKNSIDYTGNNWKEKDLFNFKKYNWTQNTNLFYHTVYKVIYVELLNRLGQEKLDALNIQQEMKEKKGILKTDKMFFEIQMFFKGGFEIKEIINYLSKFENYKEYKKSGYKKESGLIVANVSLQEYLRMEKNQEMEDDGTMIDLEQVTDWTVEAGGRGAKFREEFLGPLYDTYDEQIKLIRELDKSPLAKQLYEQNKILKKQMEIKDEEEPIFSFADKMANDK